MIVIKSKYIWISALRAGNFSYYIHIIGNQNYILLKTLNEASCTYLLNKIKKKKKRAQVAISIALYLVSVQLPSRVQLFVTPRTAARQASLSITNSRRLPKGMSIELVMPSNHLILCCPLFFLPSIFPSIRVFSNESLHQVAKILEFQFQNQSFPWTPRTDLL